MLANWKIALNYAKSILCTTLYTKYAILFVFLLKMLVMLNVNYAIIIPKHDSIEINLKLIYRREKETKYTTQWFYYKVACCYLLD